MKAELDNSRNEIEGLRKFDSARSESVSSVNSVGTPLDPTRGAESQAAV